MADLPIVPADVWAPRTEEQRWRIYIREGDGLTLLATCGSPAALGVTLVTLDEDERDAGRRGLVDRGVVGILDCVTPRWLLLPWRRGERGWIRPARTLPS